MKTKEIPPAIELHEVHKAFGRQTVLNGIDLTVASQETVVVLGRSGTGKSVLLKLIVGLQKPDSGSIRIHGEEIGNLPVASLNTLRAKVGFLFQEGALYDSLSIEDNVAFPLRHHDHMPEGEVRDRVQTLLGIVGMQRDALKRPSEISGGMKKRVGLARALALEPDILLFDEPTAGLDPITAAEIEQLIVQLQQEQKVASVVVTHDVHGAKAVADRLVLLHEGAIVAEGTFDELKQSDHPIVSQFLREDG
jgi:phospholipid/cholesterol/gamma-HCH transport system ATP-binding protein